MKKLPYFMLGLILLIGVLIVFFFLVVCILQNRMILPEQPPLTRQEQEYFKVLKEQYHCTAKREVNNKITVTGNKNIAEGWYAITLDSIPQGLMEHADSLALISKKVARELHTQVLHRSLDYKYKNISVLFSCPIGPSTHKTEGFKYDIKELK